MVEACNSTKEKNVISVDVRGIRARLKSYGRRRCLYGTFTKLSRLSIPGWDLKYSGASAQHRYAPKVYGVASSIVSFQGAVRTKVSEHADEE